MARESDARSANVDPGEISKFSALAHRWWDPESEFKPLHDINPLRLGWIEQVAGGLAGKRVLDVGCGGGILCEAMASASRQGRGPRAMVAVRSSPGTSSITSARVAPATSSSPKIDAMCG